MESVERLNDESGGPLGRPAKTSDLPGTTLPHPPEPFVGRSGELDTLSSLLDPGSAIRLLVVHGSVGVGKSWLLRAFAGRCAERGAPVAWSEDSPLEADDLARHTGEPTPGVRPVWIHDCNISPAELEDMVAGEHIECFPADILVVVTSRRRPSPSVSLFDAQGTRMRSSQVSTFDHEQAGELLEQLQVPLSQRHAIASFAGGSPLLLALGARLSHDRPAGTFDPEHAEDAIRSLLPTLQSGASTVIERTTLRMCAMARRTTPEMLAAVLEDDVDVEGLFAWLASQPFIDDTPEGLRMQQVARRAYLQELRAHYPNEYLRQHRRIKEYCASQVGRAIDGNRWLACVFYLDRHVSELRHYVVWESDPASRDVEVAKAGDWDLIHRAVLEHEGEDSARILRHWAETVPECVEVVRAADRTAEGLLVTLPVDATTAELHAEADPAMGILQQHVDAKGATTEPVWGILHRHWMDLRSYQSPSPVLTQLLIHMVARGIGLRDVPFTFGVTRDAQAWLRLTRILDLPAEHAGEFEVDGRGYTIIAVDWRGSERSEWPQRFARRMVDEVGPSWWNRVCGATQLPGRHTLRETLRPGVADGIRDPSPCTEIGAGEGLGDLIMRHMRSLAREADLTKREIEVLDLLLLGRNTEEVALVLDISPRTAKFHQSNVLRKLGADSKADLVRLLL